MQKLTEQLELKPAPYD